MTLASTGKTLAMTSAMVDGERMVTVSSNISNMTDIFLVWPNCYITATIMSSHCFASLAGTFTKM